MSDAAAEIKDTTVASPEKEVAAKDTPASDKVEEKETNGDAGEKKNGVAKDDEKPAENGDSNDAEDDEEDEEEEASSEVAKRKSDVIDGDEKADKDVSPAKKSKVEEKVENGEAEAVA